MSDDASKTTETADEIRTVLRGFIERELSRGAAFADDESFFEMGILDSMAVIRLLELMEHKLGVDLPESERDEMDNFETLDAMTAMVLRSRSA